MGRSRTVPLLATGVTLIVGALLVVVIPGMTARSGALNPAASPDMRVHLPWSAALRTPAPASSPVPTTTAARGPVYLAVLDLQLLDLIPSTDPGEWGPPRRIEPPDSPDSRPAYALPVPFQSDGWGPPKSTGPPPPVAEGRPGNGWSPAAGMAADAARPGTGPVAAAAVPAASAARVAPPLARPNQAAYIPFAAPSAPGADSDGYLVIGAVLLLAGGGLIVLARGIEASRPRRRRRGAHRHAA